MTPPMYDTFNIDVLKVKMSMYLKILGMHVYLATTKKSYLDNNKHIEANAQALMALRNTLSKDIYTIYIHKEERRKVNSPCIHALHEKIPLVGHLEF